jgi:hypothetical protein
LHPPESAQKTHATPSFVNHDNSFGVTYLFGSRKTRSLRFLRANAHFAHKLHSPCFWRAWNLRNHPEQQLAEMMRGPVEIVERDRLEMRRELR